jgi:hypothetical protein
VAGIIQGIQLPYFIKKNANYSIEFNFFKDVDYAKAWLIEEKERLAYRQTRNEFYLEVTTNVGGCKSLNFPVPTIEEPPFVIQYGMSEKGDLTIEKGVQNFYKMTLPITLKFTNLDTRNSISLFSFVSASLDMFLQDGSKPSLPPLRPQTGQDIKLEPGQKDVEVSHVLTASTQFTEAKFKEVAYCRCDEIGTFRTQKYGQIILKPLEEPFDVKVSYKEG